MNDCRHWSMTPGTTVYCSEREWPYVIGGVVVNLYKEVDELYYVIIAPKVHGEVRKEEVVYRLERVFLSHSKAIEYTRQWMCNDHSARLRDIERRCFAEAESSIRQLERELENTKQYWTGRL